MPRDRGLYRGRHAPRPQLFGWGSPWWIARMIRKPRSSDKYGFLNEKQENQMPPFGPDQIISSDLDALVRYLKDDYPKPAANATSE